MPRLIIGRSGEIRTHGPISEPSVFKTVFVTNRFDLPLVVLSCYGQQ